MPQSLPKPGFWRLFNTRGIGGWDYEPSPWIIGEFHHNPPKSTGILRIPQKCNLSWEILWSTSGLAGVVTFYRNEHMGDQKSICRAPAKSKSASFSEATLRQRKTRNCGYRNSYQFPENMFAFDLGRRHALQIGVATVNLRMAVTPVQLLAATLRRLAPWVGHAGQGSWLSGMSLGNDGGFCTARAIMAIRLPSRTA